MLGLITVHCGGFMNISSINLSIKSHQFTHNNILRKVKVYEVTTASPSLINQARRGCGYRRKTRQVQLSQNRTR